MSKAFYWTYGWVWGRWWTMFTNRASFWDRWHRAQRALWPSKGALIDYPVRHFLVNAMRSWEMHCPHCRYQAWTDHEDLFVLDRAGSDNTPNGHFHWFRGQQTCARCGTTHEYGDSD